MSSQFTDAELSALFGDEIREQTHNRLSVKPALDTTLPKNVDVEPKCQRVYSGSTDRRNGFSIYAVEDPDRLSWTEKMDILESYG